MVYLPASGNSANSMVLFAGAEVLKAFNGTSPTVDIDFAAGDDIVDGGDVTSTASLLWY